jgi:hypothetical protein
VIEAVFSIVSANQSPPRSGIASGSSFGAPALPLAKR